MVRLRREIEGIVVDQSIPLPAYALGEIASSLVLPEFDRLLQGVEGARILVAGAPRTDLAIALADAGRQVTITDLETDTIRGLHGRLPPAVLGRINLVDKPYSETTFSASAFDAAIYHDLLHRHPQPEWLIHKVQRELKVDGMLYARLFVRGSLSSNERWQAHIEAVPTDAAQQTAALAGHGLAIAVEAAATGRLSHLALNADGRDAIDRGAHLPRQSFAGLGDEQLGAVASRLRIEKIHVGHGIRRRLASLLYGARSPLQRALIGCCEGLPETADQEDLGRSDPRVVGVVARKALADLGRRRRRR